jgi:outer membrane protein assembly factor BamE (lipoprotein component of BamABCDE complex)
MRFTSRSAIVVLLVLATGLGGCTGTGVGGNPFREVQTRGYVLQDGALEQVPVGASRDQVAFVLGTPTTIATFDNSVYLYITQQVERLPGGAPTVIDQRVIAVYFDRANRVSRIANYGLEDGRVIDFVTRATPTGGREQTFIGQIFQNLLR